MGRFFKRRAEADDRLGFWRRLFFHGFIKTPSSLIAEPFEVFLVVLALLDAVSLLIRHEHGTDRPLLAYYHGAAGLYIWASSMLVASCSLLWSLFRMHNYNLMKTRRLEIFGMWIYAFAFGWYGYSNFSVGTTAARTPVLYPVISEVIISVLVIACVVRAVSLASPITALSVARVQRVKQIKKELQRLLAVRR